MHTTCIESLLIFLLEHGKNKVMWRKYWVLVRTLQENKRRVSWFSELRFVRTELFLGHGFVLHRTVADRSELASDCSVLLVDVISLCLYGKAGVFLGTWGFPWLYIAWSHEPFTKVAFPSPQSTSEALNTVGYCMKLYFSSFVDFILPAPNKCHPLCFITAQLFFFDLSQ